MQVLSPGCLEAQKPKPRSVNQSGKKLGAENAILGLSMLSDIKRQLVHKQKEAKAAAAAVATTQVDTEAIDQVIRGEINWTMDVKNDSVSVRDTISTYVRCLQQDTGAVGMWPSRRLGVVSYVFGHRGVQASSLSRFVAAT